MESRAAVRRWRTAPVVSLLVLVELLILFLIWLWFVVDERRAFGALDRRPGVKGTSHEPPAGLLRKHMLQDAFIIFSDVVFLIIIDAGLG